MDFNQIIKNVGDFIGQRVNKSVNSPAGQGLFNGLNYFLGIPKPNLPTTQASPMQTAMPTTTPGPINNKPKTLEDVISQNWGQISGSQPKPTSQPTMMPSPTAMPTPTMSPGVQGLTDKFKKGFEHWGSPPAATLSAVMAEESQKYPILQKFPELLPVLTLLESGGGKNKIPQKVNLGNKEKPRYVYPSNENRQFNWYGWGFDPQFNFNPQSPEEVIRKVAYGIGTKPQYEAFRNSGNLADLANVYSPFDPVTNPHGGDKYIKNFESIASFFR